MHGWRQHARPGGSWQGQRRSALGRAPCAGGAVACLGASACLPACLPAWKPAHLPPPAPSRALTTSVRRRELDLVDWGVSNATLEEVFIRITRDAGVRMGAFA